MFFGSFSLLMLLTFASAGNILAQETKDEVQCSGIEHDDFAEGDLETDPLNRAYLSSTNTRWPGGVVRYVFDTDITPADRTTVNDALDTIMSSTSCVRFNELGAVPTDGDPYVIIVDDDAGCFANLGYSTFFPRRRINLGNNCFNARVVIHEFLHILGSVHEQQRPDRDSFVTIRWSNIKDAAAESNYFRYLGVGQAPNVCTLSGTDGTDYQTCTLRSTVDTFGLAYDFASIMHYFAFGGSQSIDRTLPVITKLDGSTSGVGGSVLSPLDIQKLEAAYCPLTTTTPPAPSSPSPSPSTSPSPSPSPSRATTMAPIPTTTTPVAPPTTPASCIDNPRTSSICALARRAAFFCRIVAVRRFCPVSCGSCAAAATTTVATTTTTTRPRCNDSVFGRFYYCRLARRSPQFCSTSRFIRRLCPATCNACP